MLRWTLRAFLPLTLVGVVACGGEAGPEEAAAPAAVRAATALAEKVDVPRHVELAGVVEADRSAAVSTRVMATVTAVHVREGETVRPGQLLLEIDPAAAQGQVSQARGALAQAQAALALARRNHERYQALAASESASELEVDMARMQLEQAEGAVEQARGAVAAASSVASDSRVVAPFAGRIAGKMVDVGDLAAPGRPLLRIEATGGRRLSVPVPESVVHQASIATGIEVPAAVDVRPDLGWMPAPVVEMTPGADPGSLTYTAKLALPADDVPTGSAGRARFPTGSRAAVAVPAEAVVHQGGLDLVVIRTDEGTTGSRVVTLGGTLPDGRREILSGLSGGETVLVGLGALPPAGSPIEEAGR